MNEEELNPEYGGDDLPPIPGLEALSVRAEFLPQLAKLANDMTNLAADAPVSVQLTMASLERRRVFLESLDAVLEAKEDYTSRCVSMYEERWRVKNPSSLTSDSSHHLLLMLFDAAFYLEAFHHSIQSNFEGLEEEHPDVANLVKKIINGENGL